MKFTTSITLLALLFVLVFAGTLSGAFGVEESLVQNGKIEGNVADASGSSASSVVSISSFANSPTTTTIDITKTFPNYYANRGRTWSTSTDHTTNHTWSSTSWGIGNNDWHSGTDYAHVSFDFDLGADWNKYSDSIKFTLTGNVSNNNVISGYIFAIMSSNSTFGNVANGDLDSIKDDNNISFNGTVGGGGSEKTYSGSQNEDKYKKFTGQMNVSHTVKGRYVRIFFGTWSGNGRYGSVSVSNVNITLTRTKKSFTVAYNANGGTGTISSTAQEYMTAFNVSNSIFSRYAMFQSCWNTASNGSGLSLDIGESISTSVEDGTLGGVIKTNLGNGNTTTTLYAQWVGISFVFNRKTYSAYNGEVLQVLQGRSDYLTSTVSTDYTTVITYKTSNGDGLSSAPTTVGNYIATITVSKGSQTRGTVELPFAVIEGDFGKLSSGTSGKWGSATNPYVISTSLHLSNLSGIVNGTQAALNSVNGSDDGAVTADMVQATDVTYANCYFVVTQNIDMRGISFAPIGNSNDFYFRGVFYGGTGAYADAKARRTITLSIDISSENVGLFGYIWQNGASTRPSVQYIATAGSIKGLNYVGGVVGWAQDADILQCANGATVSGTSNVGGVVGYNFGSRTYDCTNDGSVNGASAVGGVVGEFNWGSVYDNTNNGEVKGTQDVGGILGRHTTNGSFYGTFRNTGKVSGTSNVGGIVGYTSGGFNISNSSNTAVVDGAYYVGGLVGHATVSGTITDSNNGGNVIARGDGNQSQVRAGGIVGGIDGSNDYTISISGCTNTGNVTASGVGTYGIGGIVGYHSGGSNKNISVEGCTNGGTISGKSETGGIVGYTDYATISNCHNNGVVGGFDNLGGIVGKICGGSVTGCDNTQSVTGDDHVGGIVGNAQNLTIENCQNYGAITSNKDKGVAGIVGSLAQSTTITIKNCENSGNIVGAKVNGAAGILGYTDSSSCDNKITVSNCKNTGSVTARLNAGGIGGRIQTSKQETNSITFTNCYNGGTIRTEGDNNGTVGGIVGYLYYSGTAATTDVAVVSYCANEGNTSDDNNVNVGGIVGNPNALAKASVRIEYSYTVKGQVAGVNNATVDATAYTIVAGTSAPSITGGSYFLYDSATTSAIVPLVASNKVTWADIQYQNIDGFYVTTNVAAGDYYVSLNGVGGALLTPVNFTSVGSSSFVVEAEYSAEQGNIYVDTADIVLVSKTVTYDKQAHTIDAPTLPDGYAFATLYFTNADAFTDGKGTASRTDVDDNPYCTETKVLIGNTVVGRMADKNYGTLTITKRELTFTNTWSDALYPNVIDRATQNNFVYNTDYNGLSYSTGVKVSNMVNDVKYADIFNITYTTPDQNGEGFLYRTAGTYFRRYTLTSTNYTIKDHADGIVEYKWTIAKNKLTIDNVWTSDNIGGSPYTFVYNGQNQGVKNVLVSAQPDTKGNTHTPQASVYTIDQILYSTASFVKNVGEYSGIFTLNDTANYEIGTTVAYVDGVATANATGLDGVTRNGNVITYAWKINQFDIESAFNAATPQAWFGAGENMLVSNQDKVKTEKVGNVEYSYYYLQKSKDVTPQILVYENSDYNKQNFVLYIKYTTYVNGTAQTSIAKLVIGTDYEIADLTTAGDKHVADATVTASGENNFKGTISKYYVVLNSDFGGNINQANWGSASNPYVIENPVQMLRLSQIVNGGVAWNSINSTDTSIALAQNTNAVATGRDYRNAYFVVSESYTGTLVQTVSGTVGFEPIGSAAYPFKAASFEREGTTNVTIEYSYSNESREYAGLFGYIDGTYIHGIDVVGVGMVSASNYLGGIVGYANGGKIEDCTFSVSAAIQARTISGKDHVGGLVGYANGTAIIHNSDTNDYGKLMQASVSGVNYVGGIVGEWIVTNANQINGDSYILSYANDFTVTGSGSYAGGIAGKLDASGCATDLTYLGLYTNGKAVTGSDNVMDVVGVNYVGALFGAFIGNGYHYDADNSGVRSVILVKSLDDIRANVIAGGDGVGYVMGGLIGYAEKVGILIGCDWTSETMVVNSNTIAKTGVYVNAKGVTSFVGGLVGVLGENATIESVKQEVAVVGGTATISGGQYSVVNKIAINGKDFVGGLIGYIASSAGSYFGTTGTILGNSIKFYNEAAVSGANYVGGIVGGLGIVDGYSSFIGSDSDDVLKNLLSATLNSKQSILGYSTLESDPYTQNPFGKLINVANVTGSGNYVGGIFGYVGDRVSLTLENAPISTAMNAGELDTPYGYLNVYNGNKGLTGGSAITVKGSQYVGGIAGWLDNQAHDLTFVVNRSYVNGTTYAGGLVGYMRAGTITSSIAVAPDDVTASTNTYIGTTYIGGLVGYVDHGTISGSMSTGFSFGNVNANNGGIIGNGISPTIENTWTIYVAKDATYSTVSTNGRGKYLLLDSTVENVPSILQIARMTGLYVADMAYLGNTYTVGKLLVNVSVPSASNNKQLAFYDVSGSDNVTDNMSVDGSGNVTATNFTKFGNFDTSDPNALTIEWTFDNANSFSVCTVAIEFVNIPNYKDTNYNQNTAEGRKNAQDAYREPSASKLYVADVTNAEYWWYKDGDSNKGANNEGQIKKLTAVIYFKYANTLVKVGETGNYRIGDYDKDYSNDSIGSKENPIIISTQAEWNEFAYSVYTGAKTYSGQYIKLTTDITINNSSHADTNGNNLDFGAVASVPANGTTAPDNLAYNFAGNVHYDNGNRSFQGNFDGNGHTITINYVSGGYYRISVFPNAKNATFKNLTVDGQIMAASQMNGARGVYATAAYDIAGFVGKPFGNLSFVNCINKANITGLRNVAGILGYNPSGYTIQLESCVNSGNIISLEGSFTLGGETRDNTKYSYDDGWGNKAYPYGTGGIIGGVTGDLTIESCRNTGNITGGHNVGGIIGYSDGTGSGSGVKTLTIDSCANTGRITANSGNWDEGQGGYADESDTTPRGSVSRGVRQNIFGYAGGLVGRTGEYSLLKMFASYNSGEVVTYSNISGGLVGGVGYMGQGSGEKNSVITPGKSVIAYCYNVGTVKAGGTFPKHTENWGVGQRENHGGDIVGGIAGLVGNILVTDCYNVGDVYAYGITCYGGSWQLRAGGIVGQSDPVDTSQEVMFRNIYNAGTVYCRSIYNYYATYNTVKNLRYGAAISGYCDDENNSSTRIKSENCYTIAYAVDIRIAEQKQTLAKYINQSCAWYDERRENWCFSAGFLGWGDAKETSVVVGTTYDTYEKLTAAITSSGTVQVGANITSDADINFGQSYESIDADLEKLSSYPSGWIYVYGCLPQLSVFALDTYNGLSMRSVNYGLNIYGEYERQEAGEKYSPYVIKDGIDLLGLQALVDLGYDFSGKYIEFANGTNNLSKSVSKTINMATSKNSYMFKYSSGTSVYATSVGKSYHLFNKGAINNQGRKGDNSVIGTDYTNWLANNHYYDQANGRMASNAAFATINFMPIGRKGGSNIFKGNISGKQADGTNTEVANLRIISSSSNYAFAGLFARVESANISYISVSGSMKAYGTYVAGHSIVGGIAADTSGNTVIDHCNAGTTSRSLTLEAHGKNDAYYSGTVDQLHTYAGGIVGIANTSFYTGSKHEYRAGTTSVIKNCNTVNATVQSAKNNIGGVVGYASATSLEGTSNADGKNNKIEITDNVVTSANLSAFTASGTGNSDIGTKVGGVLGYSDKYIAVVISGCTVGTDSTTASVTITGENAIGGIVGAMPNAINEIKDCSVKASTLIQRGNSWGIVENVSDKSAGDDGDHGTAIGGIVGYTYHNAAENAVTITLSGNISFAGKINIDYPTQDDAVRNVGGIFGDMASGASFATGAVINVTGTISVKDTIKTDNQNADNSGVRNIGGVAGRTRDVAFSGDFTVSANIVIPNAYNVGGFIGRNRGEVNILADNTVIKIGGTLEGSHGVGGFIGNNDADYGAILYIGANEYRRTRYEKPLSIEISQGATISASGDNVGGIVGNNASVDGTGKGSIQIVKGSITNNGTVSGANAVGGIIGNNNAGLVTGGGTGSDAVKKLTIVNGGAVSGINYVGGVIGKLNRGTIAGTFVNNGDVTGKLFVGGSIGYVAFDAVITVAGGVATEFKNGAKEDAYTASGDALTADGDTVAQGVGSVSGEAYVGGSIGILLGKITGTAEAKVIFTSSGKVNATAAAGYLGGSIGALAGEVSYTQFISSGDNMSDIDAITAVGGSVGFIGVPTPLLAVKDGNINCTAEYAIDLSDVKITVVESHFESNGNVKLTGSSAQIAEAKKNDGGSGEKGEFEWGGVGGAIGVIAGVSNGFNGGDDWKDNTYYAEGNVTAPGIYNVGGIVGFIRANGIKINNLLAYDITVDGATNVGGIIGSTIGTGTVIEYAFSISSTDGTGLFTASDERGQAGGIIGKAIEDTDASTSYWVKGYKNAELAGTDASRLKDTLGLYTAITEKIQNSDGSYTTVIFTKELVGTTAEDGSAVTENAVYPTPYDYIDAVGAHTVNGENVTLEATLKTDETGAITKRDWKWYFETYYTNAEFANDTWVLKKPNWKAYSTGTEQTGWYFVYANDTVTDDIVGTVDAAHKSATATNLKDKDFWKRIANAYTNEERQNGDDVREIYSTIVSSIDADNTVSGGGLLLENNLYATATAANENKSGYYLYIASSGTSRPTAIHGTNDDKFYIQINTAIDKTTIAKNVAVYYRSFAMGSALTYNGYSRFAPISLQKDIKSEQDITDGVVDTTKKNTYAYSTTLVGDNADKGAKFVGSYKSNVFVYYYDDAGKAYKVGGIKEGQWKIKQRSLTFSATSVNNKVYGDKDIESKVTIQNVAPNDRDVITFVLSIKGVDTPITISDLKAGKTYSAKDYQGIEITLVTASQDGSLSGTDANFIAETITDKSTYKIEFNIKFTNAKKYEISTSLAEGLSKTNYVMSNTDQNVEVKKRRIDVKIDSNNKSVFFDGKYNHGTTWTFSNIADAAYGDTWQSVLKVFSPLFVADIEKDGGGYNTYTSDLVNDKSLTYNGVTLQYDGLGSGRITFTGAGDVGNYYLRFSNYGQNDANNTSNYYINLTDGESESYAVSKNMLNITWSRTNNGKHVYDKSTIGTITASVVADHEIADFKSFVETYFTREWAGTKGETDISVASNNSTTATITFRTAVNAGTYTAKLTVNKQTNQDKINCSYTFKNGTIKDDYSTYSYTIEKRYIGVAFEYTSGGSDYTYNTRHQGLTGIRVTTYNGNANSGLVGDDSVSLRVTVNGENVLVSYGYKGFSASFSTKGSYTLSGVDTIDVGDYTVAASLTASTNYQFSGASDTWSIKQYSLSLGGLADGSKVYDGVPFKPTLNINGSTVNDGVYTYFSDTITVKYTATSTAGNAFVNVGEYNVSIGGSNAISAKRGSNDTTPNYKVDGTSSAKYTITPRTITLTWETIAEFVFNASTQGLKLAGATSDAGGKVALRSGGSITSAQITGYAGGDVIHISISGGKVNVKDTPATMSASIASVSGTNSDGSNSIAENYVLANEVSDEYKITPSKLTIAYSSGSVNKVYDATRNADVSGLTFSVTSTNGGASISQSSFTITGVYDDKNVGYGTKTVTVTFVFNDDSGNYEYVGEETLDIAKIGTITPKELEVKLDKLRSGKATRVYNGDTLYGGIGAVYSGGTSARSAVYRSGEGFVVNGFPTAEQSGTVTISANYKEAETKRSMFDSYVNFVYGDDANGYQKGTYTSGYFKTLVFSISGTCAINYTFTVTNGSEAYSDTVGSATQAVTVYDSRDEQNKDKRPSSAGNINIEITVKSFKVEYTNTSQSYANSDNTYNTDWKPVEATKTPDGTKVTVLNGWMYENGESGAMKVYKAYTVIRGRMGYKQLSAQVSGEKGMELNYNMSNQPILTIGYFVDNTDFEIGSIASLMIASYYWYASQHQDAPDFNPIISAGSDWISIVTNTDYGTGDFKDNKPTDAPEDCNSWDDYFAYIEQKENVTVFLNEYEGNSWGYYKTTQSTSDKTYTSFKQTADISGIVTQTDIEILNSFFTVYTFADDGTATTVQKTWGVGGEYITNFVKPSVGNVLTAIGSVFVSTSDGFGGTYNGNGYVIEYLNIFGYAGAGQNVGMFDKIGNGSVSGLHLRNVTISANGGNVGGIAGEILAGEASNEVSNVSFHGSITVSGIGNVGGLFGKSARNIGKAIVLGTITANGGNVAGVVGSMSGKLSNAVSLMQVDASGTVAPIANGGTVDNVFYLADAVWSKDGNGTISFAGGNGTAKSYAELMNGSTSGYGANKYYYSAADSTGNTKGTYDVIDDVALTSIDVEQKSNPRQSMRLRDVVDVYLLMYSLSETTATESGISGAKTYTISATSWLVGDKHGTSKDDAIVIANKQNVALLRQLRFATFILQIDLSIDGLQQTSGAFYGTIYQNGHSISSDWLAKAFVNVEKATVSE